MGGREKELSEQFNAQRQAAAEVAEARAKATQAQVSQSVDHTYSSHLGLITCPSLIVRVSTQYHIQTCLETPGRTHRKR